MTNEYFCIKPEFNQPPHTLVVNNTTTGKPIITVTREGRLYWGEREVETDEEFRGMMMEWAKIMIGNQ